MCSRDWEGRLPGFDSIPKSPGQLGGVDKKGKIEADGVAVAGVKEKANTYVFDLWLCEESRWPHVES